MSKLKEQAPPAQLEGLPSPPRLEPTGVPLMLGKLIAPVGEDWFVDFGSTKGVVEVDSCVDPALLEEAYERGARVVVDAASDSPCVVGLLATRRALEVDGDGNVDADVRSFRIRADEEVLLRAPGAYFRAKKAKVEIYGNKVVTRARDLAKILSAMIKLN